MLHGFLQSQQAALSQPAVQEGKDADKGILADKAFLNALVIKDTIIRAFLEENDDCIDAVNEMIEDGTLEADGKISEDEFVKALFVNNVTVFVNGSETGFYIDLDAEPDYFMGHLACMEVDCQYRIEAGGLNG